MCKNYADIWGNNEVLTAADCRNPSKWLRYSNRTVSNFDIIKPLLF